MKKNIISKVAVMILLSAIFFPLRSQNLTEKAKGEITETLKTWNNADYNSDTEQLMSLFDDSENIMLIGSNKGEPIKAPYRFTGIMVKKNNVWKWRLFDGSMPDEE